MHRTKGALVVFAIAAGLLVIPGALARAAYTDTLTGTEIVPITSTLGTFVGVATGEFPGAWRVQIAHAPLAGGPTVRITGGTFTLVTQSGKRLRGPVSGGSVTVTNRGSHCANQTYHVTVAFKVGSFDGSLTHHRRSLLGHCVIYAATIQGTGIFNV